MNKRCKEATFLSLFQNVTLKGNHLPKHGSTKFPWAFLTIILVLRRMMHSRNVFTHPVAFISRAANPSRTTVQTAS